MKFSDFSFKLRDMVRGNVDFLTPFVQSCYCLVYCEQPLSVCQANGNQELKEADTWGGERVEGVQ